MKSIFSTSSLRGLLCVASLSLALFTALPSSAWAEDSYQNPAGHVSPGLEKQGKVPPGQLKKQYREQYSGNDDGDRRYDGDRRRDTNRRYDGDRRRDEDREYRDTDRRRTDRDHRYNGDHRYDSDRRYNGDHRYDSDRRYNGDRRHGRDADQRHDGDRRRGRDRDRD